MFVRSNEVKGVMYYRVVEGYRDTDGVSRSRTVVALGRYPSPVEALKADQTELACLKSKSDRSVGENRRISQLTGRIAKLAGVVESGKVKTRRVPERLDGPTWVGRLRKFVRTNMPDVAEKIEREYWRGLDDAFRKACAMGFVVPPELRRLSTREWHRADHFR